jgi:hypothetical protein
VKLGVLRGFYAVPGSRRLDYLFHGDAMQAPACGFVTLPIGSFGKGYHTPKKILTAEDPFAQFLLEWIMRRGEAFFHISSIRSERVLPADGRLPSGVKLVVGDPASALALASIARKAAVRPGFRIAGQRLAAVARIQVNVATERPAVACVFDQERFTINPKTND